MKTHIQKVRDGSSKILTFDYLGKSERVAREHQQDSKGFFLFDVQLKHERNLNKIERLMELNQQKKFDLM